MWQCILDSVDLISKIAQTGIAGLGSLGGHFLKKKHKNLEILTLIYQQQLIFPISKFLKLQIKLQYSKKLRVELSVTLMTAARERSKEIDGLYLQL
tara:strand:- start:1948 stop:2235 length:288 start_codon:yes stop_codon:yes gene_type:complete